MSVLLGNFFKTIQADYIMIELVVTQVYIAVEIFQAIHFESMLYLKNLILKEWENVLWS